GWRFLRDASYDTANNRLQLTSLNTEVAGSAFLTTPLATPAFDARFSFRIADGAGGDGMAFVFAKAARASDLVPFGNHQPGRGFGLGYLGMHGFAVQLATFKNVRD